MVSSSGWSRGVFSCYVLPMLLPFQLIDLVRMALREDLSSGDLTTEATVPSDVQAVAIAHARGAMTVCGGPVFRAAFLEVDPSLQVTAQAREGQRVDSGASLWTVTGSARSILMAERVALNFVQRMSGIATMTSRFVDAVPDASHTRIVDTRKTTPGLRLLERYAVRTGGAVNHRDNLGSAVMIKDNHIVAAGGIEAAVQRARQWAPHTARVEVEVDTLEQLQEALRVRADIIMLDNFSLADTRSAVEQTAGRAVLEASGGVTLDRVRDLAIAGVDVISVGGLTHSAPSADIGLDMELQ